MPENIGHVIQVSGPAVDVQFAEGTLPPIYEAVKVVSDGFTVPSPINVILEVQQHLGEGRVRCIAMSATDGMVRGMKAIDQGGPISVPVGRGTLGRAGGADCGCGVAVGCLVAEQEQRVARHHRVIARTEADQTGHADVIRVVPFDELFAAHRVDDRCAEHVRERHHFVMRTRSAAAAHQRHRFRLFCHA